MAGHCCKDEGGREETEECSDEDATSEVGSCICDMEGCGRDDEAVGGSGRAIDIEDEEHGSVSGI